MIIKLETKIPSWSSTYCQYQILQILENFDNVRKILDMGTMFGSYAVAFAKTFPKAEIIAVDLWEGEDSGLEKGLLNTQANFKKFTQGYNNISCLKMDYTDLNQIKNLPKDCDFIYFGGEMQKNLYELFSHFNSHCVFTGIKYPVVKCEPSIDYTENCKITLDKIQFKKQLLTVAKKLGRIIIPFGCYNWLMPAVHLNKG